jgi:two-component system invasion response regulator UvrY
MIQVIVIDDHDLVRMGICRLLEDVAGVKVIGEGRSGEEAVLLAKEHQPDVILMDVRMPGMGGLEATRKIKRLYPDIAIVVVTACIGDPYPSKLLQAGAAGFITKEANLAEMTLAIQKVHLGQKYLSPEIAQRLALNAYDGNPQKDGPFADLSDRELQIAMLIVSCKKVQEISDSLFLSPKTVNTYRYRLFAKLNIESDVELALLAVKHGLLDPSEA